MALPITIPYTFGTATAAIPLSNLDSDYQTVYYAVNGIGNGTVALANVQVTGVGTTFPNNYLANSSVTIGNTAVALGSTAATVGNVTLTNVTISSVASTFPNNYLSNTSVTLGNTALTLGSTVTSVGNATVANVTVTNYIETVQSVGTVGATSTLTLTTGTFLTATLTASTPCTFTMPTATAGKSFTIIVTYSGAYSLTWAGGGTLKWAGGTTPTATSVSGKYDIFNFYQDGTNTYGSVYGLNY